MSLKEEIVNKKCTAEILTIKEKELNEEIAPLLHELSP